MSSTPDTAADVSVILPTGPFHLSDSLQEFRSDEQRRVLDVVTQIRKYGLNEALSLPQIVVCGDQSAGKSSVLEALTEIPFPRSDNLCTRFATEITLQRGPVDKLKVVIIPDSGRSNAEKDIISAFSKNINDFSELPSVIEAAKDAMGVGSIFGDHRSFSRDVLSIVIEGPGRPHLTLVDVPGLIQTETKGSTEEDQEMVARITNDYIRQPRTICLAVISATHDYANQPILTKVRDVDPEGKRALGIITKPDRLDSGSGLETDFLGLARNQDIFFELRWHVVKNRGFQETAASLSECNASEKLFFKKSNFRKLAPDCRGIAALRTRLSALLFEHVKRELPSLRKELEEALRDAEAQLTQLGAQRVSSTDCRLCPTDLCMDFLQVTRDAVGGHWRGEFFRIDANQDFDPQDSNCIRRLRAAVQRGNAKFEEETRRFGAKFAILPSSKSTDEALGDNDDAGEDGQDDDGLPSATDADSYPIAISRQSAIDWVE